MWCMCHLHAALQNAHIYKPLPPQSNLYKPQRSGRGWPLNRGDHRVQTQSRWTQTYQWLRRDVDPGRWADPRPHPCRGGGDLWGTPSWSLPRLRHLRTVGGHQGGMYSVSRTWHRTGTGHRIDWERYDIIIIITKNLYCHKLQMQTQQRTLPCLQRNKCVFSILKLNKEIELNFGKGVSGYIYNWK